MFDLDDLGPVLVSTPRDRRHAATRGEILAAAWELARRDGLLSISLRELGKRVGLQASSLYSYFDSKGALYDAMFAEGYRELLDASAEWAADAGADSDPLAAFVDGNRRFVQFCVDDPVRYQLLFLRTVPDWEPSPESYGLALAFLDRSREVLAAVGVVDERAVDLWSAIVTGLTSQQISNDPGGDRWVRLADDAITMFLARFSSRLDPTSEGTT
jgi:AcrR family transcriptional regulator